MIGLLIAGVIGALVLFSIIFAALRRYKRCPSNRILVVYGKVGQKSEGGRRTAKCIHGGAAFVWPVIQAHGFLDLKPFDIDVDLKGALSKQNIRVDLPTSFTVAISTLPGVMENAAERLLGLSPEDIRKLAEGITFGQMRLAVAQMDIEGINADRENFVVQTRNLVEQELNKVGLTVVNVNTRDVRDESGYLKALGQEAASRAINEAKVKVAERDRDGAIGEAQANQERRTQVAEADAAAVSGENTAKATVADSNAELAEKQAEAKRRETVAERTKAAEAEKEAYAKEQEAQVARAEMEQARRYAEEVVPAEIKRQAAELNAKAQLALSIGEADGIKAELDRRAEGFRAVVEASGGDVHAAITFLMLDRLPDLIAAQAEAIKGVKIDKVTVWDGGGQGDGGKTATAGFLRGMVGVLPPLHEILANVGVEAPPFLGSMKPNGTADQQTIASSEADPAAE